MGIRIAGRRFVIAGLAVAASWSSSWAQEATLTKTTLARLEPGSEIIVLPAAHFEQAGNTARTEPAPLPTTGTPSPIAMPAPMLPSDITGSSCGPDGCRNGNCELYYRDRPRGCRDDKRHTILQNRSGEPDWYKYYRKEHFGYHPTTWMAWPENWLMCRNPVPGPHPYDLKQPESTAQKKPKNSTDSDKGSRTRTPPERLPVEKDSDAPKPLPKKNDK